MALTLLWGLEQRGEKARSRVADTEILYLGLNVIGVEVFAPSLHAAPEGQAFVFKEINTVAKGDRCVGLQQDCF